MQKFISMRRGALLAIVAVSGLSVWQGLASAASTAGKGVRVPIQRIDSCGQQGSDQAEKMGIARFKKVGDDLTIDVKVMHGIPNTEYPVYLRDGDCNWLSHVGNLFVNSKGYGDADFTYKNANCCSSFFIKLENGFGDDSSQVAYTG